MQIPFHDKPMRISQSAMSKIYATVAIKPAETGGLGFGSRRDMIIRKVVPDPRPGTGGTYTINPVFFNPVIDKTYEEEGLEPIAIIHSHPPGYRRPSEPDIKIGNKYLDRFELNTLHFPIIISKGDKVPFAMLPYAFIISAANDRLVRLTGVEVIPDEWLPPLPVMQVQEDPKEELASDRPENPVSDLPAVGEIDYSRVEQAVSIPVMQKTRIVVVGCGGAASYCKQIARLGVGHMTLIDPDFVGPENIPRQSFVLTDAVTQQPKVVALKEAIKGINPAVTVEAVQADFTLLDTAALDAIVKPADILLFLTDSFPCQAYGNKVALAHTKPAIWAGFYRQSRAAEIFFSIPSVTNSCFRCAVSTRYVAQAKQAVKFSSAANTICHSGLLDSYLSFITLAILHNNVPGFEFSQWFAEGFDHNFLQIKTHPAYEGIFKEMHGDSTPAFFNFGAIWQQVQRETIANGFAYNCPDCCTPKVDDVITATVCCQ